MKKILLAAAIAITPLLAAADNTCQQFSGDEATACNTINSSLQQTKTDFINDHAIAAPPPSQVSAPVTKPQPVTSPMVPPAPPLVTGPVTNSAPKAPNIYQ